MAIAITLKEYLEDHGTPYEEVPHTRTGCTLETSEVAHIPGDKMGKPVGQDISNGKMTLPLILALDEAEEDDRQMVMDGLYRGDEIDAEWIHAFVERERGVEKAQERARIFARQATSVLETFEPSAYRDSWEKLVAHDLVRAG